MSSSTDDLLQEHLIVRRLRNIAQKCSDRLYASEDIQIFLSSSRSFVDAFHHGEEEKAYFPDYKK